MGPVPHGVREPHVAPAVLLARVLDQAARQQSGSMRPGVEALAARCRHVVELHIDDPRCELFVLHPIVVACAGPLQRVVINCDKDTTSRNEAAICSILWIIRSDPTPTPTPVTRHCLTTARRL